MSYKAERFGRLVTVMLMIVLAVSTLTVLTIPQAQADENAEVKGYVHDSQTEYPIEDADVSIYNGERYWYWNYTDSEGFYKISLEPGDYQIDISKDGYITHYGDIRVGDDETRWYNVTLDPKPPENSVIKGYVEDNDSRGPIEGADVCLWGEETENYTTTNASGYYEMNVAEGEYHIHIHKDGYRDHDRDITVEENETFWHNVTLEPKPPENSVVKGYVMEEESRGSIEGADVSLWGEETGNYTTTNSSGYYEMNVAEGEYHIHVHKDGYRDHDNDITVGDDETYWYNVTLIPENSVVKGYVMEVESRGPIEDANVNIRNEDDNYWNDTRTNDTGYYQINLCAGEYEFEVSKYGYHSHRDHIYIDENETLWRNVTLEPVEMVWVRGFVNDSETGDPIVDEWVEFFNEDYYDTMTEEDGYYELEVAADEEYEVEMHVEGYKRYEDEIFVEEDIWYNITLEPIPPPDLLVKGYVTDPTIRGPVKAEVGAMNFIYDADNGTETDGETGYFEFRAWSGWGGIKAMADGYYFHFHIENLTAGELWYNITLYRKELSNTMIYGYVHDWNGEPVYDADVLLVNWMTGVPPDDEEDFPYSTTTEEDGYYEMIVPDGDWYLVVNDDDHSGLVMDLTIDGNTEVNVTLPGPEKEGKMEMSFSDWDHASYTMQGPFGMDSAPHLARLQVDFLLGDMDGYVSEEEAGLLEEFFKLMMDNDGPEMDEENTEDDFYVDGIYYDFVEGSHYIRLSDMEGNITSQDPVHMEMGGDFISHTPILEADEHVILFNMSYDEDEGGSENFTLILPDGFIFDGYNSTDNITVEGIGTGTVSMEFVGEPVEDGWEMVELHAIDLNEPPVVDAGPDQTITAGETAYFEANASDTDGEIVLYEWDFVGDYIIERIPSADANHTYTIAGTYIVRVRVTDNDGATAEDELTVTVNPPAVSGPNLQIQAITILPLDPEDGDRLTVTVTLKNTGDASAENITVKIIVDNKLKETIDAGTVGPGGSVTRSYNWTAKEGSHTITINMTYLNGADQTEREISVSGGGDGIIPGFEAVVAIAAVVLGSLVFRGKGSSGKDNRRFQRLRPGHHGSERRSRR